MTKIINVQNVFSKSLWWRKNRQSWSLYNSKYKGLIFLVQNWKQWFSTIQYTFRNTKPYFFSSKLKNKMILHGKGTNIEHYFHWYCVWYCLPALKHSSFFSRLQFKMKTISSENIPPPHQDYVKNHFRQKKLTPKVWSKKECRMTWRSYWARPESPTDCRASPRRTESLRESAHYTASGPWSRSWHAPRPRWPARRASTRTGWHPSSRAHG